MKKLAYLLAFGVSTISFAQNVGINTDGSDPDTDALLHLLNTNSTALDPLIRLENQQNASVNGIQLLNSGAATAAQWDLYIPSSTTDFRVSNGTTDHVTIQNDGDVGIGTNSPSTKLEVVGEIQTTGQNDIIAGDGDGAVALTINDGGGNANLTFNHQNRVPDRTGNAGRILVNVDAQGSGAYMSFQLGSSVTAGTAVDLTPILNLTGTGATIFDNTVYHSENAPMSKTMIIESPTNSEDLTFFRTDVAITVQEVYGVVTGSSSSINFRLRHSTNRNNSGTLVTNNKTINSKTSGQTATISDPTIPANSWIWLETTSSSGSNVTLTIDIRYKFD